MLKLCARALTASLLSKPFGPQLQACSPEFVPSYFQAATALLQRSLSSSSTSAVAAATPPSEPEDSVEVCFLDPKLILHEGDQANNSSVMGASSAAELAAQGKANLLRLPRTMLPQLPHPRHELGDMDDPLNAWSWGAQGELFEYTAVGSHPTRSGFTSVALRTTLDAWLQGQKAAGAAAASTASPKSKGSSWQAFLSMLRSLEEKREGGGSAGAATNVSSGSDNTTCVEADPRLAPLLFAGRVVESSRASVYALVRGGKVEGLMVSSAAAEDDADEE